ncbi:MAG TPA: T9SS type A sorting domain-containing protein [Puia sp.]
MLFFGSLHAQHFFVSPNGSATGDGATQATPVNLARVKVLLRQHPTTTCVVYMADGTYPPFSLDATDTRPATAWAVYTAMNPHRVVFQPYNTVNRASFQPIPDSIKSRIIDATAKTKVMQIPLSAMGVADTAQWPTQFTQKSLVSPKFYKDGLPLTMSRYPAIPDSNMTVKQIINHGTYRVAPGGSFKYRNDRAKYWLKAINDGGLFLSGNWQTQFEMDVVKTQSVTLADSLITQSIGIYGGIGALPSGRLVTGTEPYYALNLVEEIAAEGQWAINFRTKMLYMWVPASGVISCAGNSKAPGIKVTGVSNTQFTNIDVHGGSGNGIEMKDCNNVQIDGGHISYCSGNGVTITGGVNCTVQSCDIDSVGAGGVIVASDNFTTDQFNVTRSNHQILNNHIYSFAREAFLYSPAIDVSNAVGVHAAYNRIHDSPHVGVLYGGNSNVLEYNDIFDVVKKYADMGAFYKVDMATFWLSRGNKLTHNYVHDALYADAFYNDNYSGGDSVNYNIVERVTMGMFNHYGFFSAYTNNIVVNTVYPVTSMAEAASSTTWSAHYNSLKTMWTNSAAYRAAYPECAEMVGPSGTNRAYTSKIWPSFVGCVFANNSGIFSNSNIDQMFNRDGTTNAAYCTTTGPIFTTWGTVFKNGIRYNTTTAGVYPFAVDTLTNRGLFNKTLGQDWHINRIGLHKDQWRANLTGLTIPGMSPVLKLKDSSGNGFKTGAPVYLVMGYKFPNATNVLSATYWMENGKPITGMGIYKRVFSADSVTYTMVLTNPSAGTHTIYMIGNDGDGAWWQYTSNSVAFTVTAPVKTADSTVRTATASRFADDSSTVARAVDSVKAADSSRLNAELSLFPNPARTQVNISYNPSSPQQNVNVVIYDMLGRISMKKVTDFQAGPNVMTMSLGNMPNGNYLLVIQTAQGAVMTRRFVINR